MEQAPREPETQLHIHQPAGHPLIHKQMERLNSSRICSNTEDLSVNLSFITQKHKEREQKKRNSQLLHNKKRYHGGVLIQNTGTTYVQHCC